MAIQEQPFQVLRMLLQADGEVVTREELCAALWPKDTFVDFEHGINTAVKKLRQALDDSAERPRFLETMPQGRLPFHGSRGMDKQQTQREPPAKCCSDRYAGDRRHSSRGPAGTELEAARAASGGSSACRSLCIVASPIRCGSSSSAPGHEPAAADCESPRRSADQRRDLAGWQVSRLFGSYRALCAACGQRGDHSCALAERSGCDARELVSR